MIKIFDRYLKILELERKDPSFEYLKDLLTAHIINIPFENISKIHYYIESGLKYIPDFDLYINGIEKHNFGGTCYSNNYYFNQLLDHLGFDVILCGADMNIPDAHLVNVVRFNSEEYLVDTGYASPFFDPIPLNSNEDYIIQFGNERYTLLPKDKKGCLQLNHFRNNEIIHGYRLKIRKRIISEFNEVIESSFRNDSTFFNRISLIKFSVNSSIAIRNFSLIKMTRKSTNVKKIIGEGSLINSINEYFKIPPHIIEEAVRYLTQNEKL